VLIPQKVCRDALRYVKLVFLQPVGYVGHIVQSGASGVQNIGALFSCLGRPGAVSIKSTPGHFTPKLFFASGQICRSHCSFRCVRGVES
jgi:hypothetical protein